MLRTIGVTISSQGFHFLDNVIGLGGQINLQILNPRPGFKKNNHDLWMLVLVHTSR